MIDTGIVSKQTSTFFSPTGNVSLQKKSKYFLFGGEGGGEGGGKGGGGGKGEGGGGGKGGEGGEEGGGEGEE